MNRLLLSLLLCLLFPLKADAISVYFDSEEYNVFLGEIFTVGIYVDIDPVLEVPVLGWGLDVVIGDDSMLSEIGPPLVGSAWNPALGADGDGLTGLGFPGVTGSGILLATLTYEAVGIGATEFGIGADNDDLTEGFLPVFGNIDYDFPATNATVTVSAAQVSEPAPLVLLGTGLVGLVGLGRRKWLK